MWRDVWGESRGSVEGCGGGVWRDVWGESRGSVQSRGRRVYTGEKYKCFEGKDLYGGGEK